MKEYNPLLLDVNWNIKQAEVICLLFSTVKETAQKDSTENIEKVRSSNFSHIADIATIYHSKEHLKHMIHADNIVMIGDSPEKLNGRREEWRESLESKGLRISSCITEYLE